jgi:hypothetical protein
MKGVEPVYKFLYYRDDTSRLAIDYLYRYGRLPVQVYLQQTLSRVAYTIGMLDFSTPRFDIRVLHY